MVSGTLEWEALAVLLKMLPRILQGSCVERPSLEGLLLRGCRNEGSQPSRNYSTLFIPTDVCAVALLEKHLCVQTGSTVSKPVRLIPALRDTIF